MRGGLSPAAETRLNIFSSSVPPDACDLSSSPVWLSLFLEEMPRKRLTYR